VSAPETAGISFLLCPPAPPDRRLIPARLRLLAAGLLSEAEPGAFGAASVAAAQLKRREDAERPFRAQHGTLAEKKRDRHGARVVVDLDESPVAALSRRVAKGGEPWLKPHATEAAERLRRDFEMGRLQPRVTANWSASVSTGRRAGDGSGISDLTEMALAARLRFDRAMRAVGPELSGVLVDVCCFLKGLETVERERLWPARSAKLVLRIALEGLAPLWADGDRDRTARRAEAEALGRRRLPAGHRLSAGKRRLCVGADAAHHRGEAV